MRRNDWRLSWKARHGIKCVRDLALGGVVFEENNQLQRGAVKPSHCHHTEGGHVPITTHPEMFYSFYTTAI